MSTDKPRFTVILDKDVYDMVERYWRINGLKNRNDGINRLLRLALDKREGITQEEQRVLREYRKSEPIARHMVMKALQAGNQYADASYSHRMPATTPLDVSTPQPSAEISDDSISYRHYDAQTGELKARITEKLPGPLAEDPENTG